MSPNQNMSTNGTRNGSERLQHGYMVSDDAIWSPLPIFTIILSITIIILNAGVIYVFIRQNCARIPFNIYLINLLAVNIIHAIILNPLDVVNFLYPHWRLNYASCTFYLYAEHIGSAAMINSHLLISLNRIWAITAPMHYRQHHTRKVAVGLCIGLWVWAHALLLPQVIADALWYRLPLDKVSCFLNSHPQSSLTMTTQFFVFVLPLAFMTVTYPVLFFLRKRQRKKVEQLETRSTKRTSGSAATNPMITTGNSPPGPSADEVPVSIPLKQFSTNGNSTTATGSEKKQKAPSHAFTVLTLLTCSTVCLWTPMIVYFTITYFYQYWNVAYFQTGMIMFLTQNALDPLYFSMVVPDLRNGFKILLHFV